MFSFAPNDFYPRVRAEIVSHGSSESMQTHSELRRSVGRVPKNRNFTPSKARLLYTTLRAMRSNAAAMTTVNSLCITHLGIESGTIHLADGDSPVAVLAGVTEPRLYCEPSQIVKLPFKVPVGSAHPCVENGSLHIVSLVWSTYGHLRRKRR